MSQRAQELVRRFEAANNAIIEYIEGCSEEDLNVESILIGHVNHHLDSIKAAVGK